MTINFIADLVLGTEMDPTTNDAEASTIREYLTKLLLTLWNEAEGFSGKRPFGNSGWDGEIATALVKSGFISGSIDEDGYLNDYDVDELDSAMRNAIEWMGKR